MIDHLFIRMDNIGDLVLNLPVDQHDLVREGNNHWFISKGLGFVLDHATPVREYTEFPKDKESLSKMVGKIKELKPKVALVFHAPWWVGKAIKKAGVPVRMGRYSQWHSFLYFNYGIRQKRSLAEMSERDYNFELLEKCFFKYKRLTSNYNYKETYTPIYNDDDANVMATFNLLPENYVVVHPGMRGSALNWPPEHYVELIKKLLATENIVITGTESDWPYIEPLYAKLNGNDKIKWLNGKMSASELIAILQNAKAVVAPSTGVIHLAASSGTPSIGIYPPIRVQSKKRWGAIGKMAVNLEAEANSQLENPMSGLSPETVFNEIKVFL